MRVHGSSRAIQVVHHGSHAKRATPRRPAPRSWQNRSREGQPPPKRAQTLVPRKQQEEGLVLRTRPHRVSLDDEAVEVRLERSANASAPVLVAQRPRVAPRDHRAQAQRDTFLLVRRVHDLERLPDAPRLIFAVRSLNEVHQAPRSAASDTEPQPRAAEDAHKFKDAVARRWGLDLLR
jgi:hypothetical protein